MVRSLKTLAKWLCGVIRNEVGAVVHAFSQVFLVIGFKIMVAQAQNTSPNARVKKGLRSRPSTSAGPLTTSPKHMPKTRAQVTPSKGW